MSFVRRLSISIKALRELGPRQLGLYAWYQLALRTGFLRGQTADRQPESSGNGQQFTFSRPFHSMPARQDLAAVLGKSAPGLLAEADEILAGRVRLFGGPPVPLQLAAPGPLAHWTVYEKKQRDGREEGDIKFTWEPGRFGWGYTLGRAYHLTGDERFAEGFWRYAEIFLDSNPPYQGPHWASGQEVALRLMACAFASQVFAVSPQSTRGRIERLARALAQHAARIPPTLSYARAQNNNHLLTEAAGLYTAGVFLPGHPDAPGWRALGWRWFNAALLSQIAEDGSYVQHSANYHRLMLQAAFWVFSLSKEFANEGTPAGSAAEIFPAASHRRLAAATRWLLALVDPETGRVPNLGPNDGANILPLSTCPFHDYRPALQAAGLAFLGERLFSEGPWDEMALWFQVEGSKLQVKDHRLANLQTFQPTNYPPSTPHVLRSRFSDSWAYLRVARFTARPGHADQLHLDLWWRGLNLAQDAGTYLYNALPPWENALASTAVHNTLTVNGLDQMTRAGRFLWLDWAQGEVVSGEPGNGSTYQRLVAQHNGYRRLGLVHRREVTAQPGGRWLVADRLSQLEGPKLKARISPSGLQPYQARLHWLLPDLPWEIRKDQAGANLEIRLKSNEGWICLRIEVGQTRLFSYQIVRAGELLSGAGPVSPTWGWVAPTYGNKIPAISFAIEVESPLPISFNSEWIFPEPEA
jgi:hypothetical protein